MQSRQSELNAAGWDVVGLPEMGVGIGVNTGRVIAGTVGGGGRLEYTVVGDAVNIASRLQNEAAGGEIVATASTVAAADGIDCEPIGLRHVKGREEAVEVFRVKGGGP
jgi:adenylate cyclase